MEIQELVTLYVKAWSEPDRSRRQSLLDQIWAEDGTYTDPLGHVAGRQQLFTHIGRFFEQFPGAHLELTSGVDTHHTHFRFTWRMILADGNVFMEGIDFGELSPDGKLHRIIGFFGPLSAKP
jgi:SnoaL-like domain